MLKVENHCAWLRKKLGKRRMWGKKEKKNDELKTQRRIGGAKIHGTGMDFGRKRDCNFEMEGSGRKR